MSSRRIIRAIVRGSILFSSVAILSSAYAVADGLPRALPPQPLADALDAFAQLSGLQVIYRSELADGLTSKGSQAGLSPKSTLNEILRDTGLAYTFVNDRMVAIRSANPDGARAAPGTAPALEVAQAQPAGGEQPTPADEGESADAKKSPKQTDRSAANGKSTKIPLEEIVVTGSNIRGSKNSASPVQVYTREEIDRTGAGTVTKFLETRSQNFSDITEISKAAVDGGRALGVDNLDGSAGANLRGLGTESTLVLVNGRRVASGGAQGSLTDVSVIPLAAIERVEIVSDGASAVYGSDAVGGVVNFIMRKDFSGSETRARYGSVIDGGFTQTTVGETLGHAWGSGSALLSYEYFDQQELDASDRKFSETAFAPFTLLPEVTRHGVFFTAQQDVAPGVNLFFDGTYAHRSTEDAYSYDDTSGTFDIGSVETYSGAAGVRADFSARANLEVSASYGAGRSRRHAIRENQGLVANRNSRPTTTSADVKLGGALWTIPTGDVLYAVGAQFRKETLDLQNMLNRGADLDISRDVTAEFIEFRIPLIGPGGDSRGNRLELTLADRNERYSDFGSTNNPKVGLFWKSGRDLTLRGTYGTSFRAPALSDLSSIPDQVVPVPMPDASGAGTASCEPFNSSTNCTAVLYINGGNSKLQPEKAKTWTVGLDFEPQALAGLKANLTYYAIDYDDRITDVGTFVPLLDLLNNEAILGPDIVQRNPSSALVQQLITLAGGNYGDFFGVDPATVTAIVDTRLRNISSVRTRGVDLALTYKTNLSFGTMEGGIEGTRILKFTNTVIPSTPTLDIVDTPYNPNGLRLRGHGALSRGGASLAVFVNYVSSYTDNHNIPNATVSSWTTLDATASYSFQQSAGPLADTSMTLSVTNVADRSPPYIYHADYPLYFDATNANPLGRFVSFQITKRL